jgi:purine-binding chemotaxis protein CheW
MQIVIFQLGGEKYAIDTANVQGINKMTDITGVPNAPQHIRGLINLRGSIITVIDPYVILRMSGEERNPENIITVETEEETLGILVDRVMEVVDIEGRTLKNVTASGEEEREYIKGTINMGDYLVTLVDIGGLLQAQQAV